LQKIKSGKIPMGANQPWKNRTDLKEFALAYAQQGKPVFPCSPKTKAPLVEGDRDQDGKLIPGTGGFYKATCNEDQIIAWWTQWPNAWIGVPTGALSDRFIVDLDRKPGQADGLVEWEKFVAENGGIEPITRRCRTPSTGEHIYFRNHPGVRNVTLGKLRPGIEIKGEGGYTIVPPSPGYLWLNDEPVRDAPPWMLDKILTPHKIPEPILAVADALISDERKRAYGEAALAEMIDEVEALQPGERSNGLNRIAFRAGQLVGGGCLSMEVARSSLESAAQSWGISSRDKALGPRGTVSRALRDGQADPKGPVDRDTADILPFLQPQAPEAPVVAAVSENLKLSLVGIPNHLLVVPGLVGTISSWINDTARYPQPMLALGAALIVVGTAAGRHIAGPTLSGTHLYINGIAPTGAGKDHSMRQISTILFASGMQAHIGPSQFISMPSVVNFMKREPLSVCSIDEFGSYLKRINNKRASGFESSISGLLRMAWGSSFAMMTTPEWAQTPSIHIHSPAMSIFALSTPREFFESLGSGDIVNGLLNRFLLIEGDAAPKSRDPLVDPFMVPQSIIVPLANIYSRLGGAMNKMSTIKPHFTTLDISTAAKKILIDLEEDIVKRNQKNPDDAPFYVRSAEIAIRLATIVTIGQQVDCIESDVMQWARDFAMWSANAMAQSAALYISDSENQAIAKEIMRIAINNATFEKNDGWGRIKRVTVLQALKNKYKRRELEEVIKGMEEAEELQQEKVPSKGGRPSIFFLIPKYKFLL
jgi:hypothetical protein